MPEGLSVAPSSSHTALPVSASRTRCDVSLIVPLAEDVWPLPALARPRPSGVDVTVAAAGSVSDSTVRRLRDGGILVRRSDAPRGARLLHAARHVAGNVLVFLHADTELPVGWLDVVLRALSLDRPWGAFRLRFAGRVGKRRLRLIAFGANARSRLLGLPFGDQAPFVRRAAYEAVGGHPPWGFLDDLELSLRLRRLAAPRIVRACVRTSPGRYLARGSARTVLTNLKILGRFARGSDPAVLEALYREPRCPVTERSAKAQVRPGYGRRET